MPNADEVEDEGTLGNGQARLHNKWFTNVKNVIVRCGNYEKFKQHVRAHNLALLANLFSNFIRSEAIEVATVRRQSEILELVSRMLEKYGVHWSGLEIPIFWARNRHSWQFATKVRKSNTGRFFNLFSPKSGSL